MVPAGRGAAIGSGARAMIRCKILGHDPVHRKPRTWADMLVGPLSNWPLYECRRCHVTEPGCWEDSLVERICWSIRDKILFVSGWLSTWRRHGD
jgi:hypothetical protein